MLAALLVVKRHGHLHIPKHSPWFSLRGHMHMALGPWKLPIMIVSATSLCGAAGLIYLVATMLRRPAAGIFQKVGPKVCALAAMLFGLVLVTGAIGVARGHHHTPMHGYGPRGYHNHPMHGNGPWGYHHPMHDHGPCNHAMKEVPSMRASDDARLRRWEDERSVDKNQYIVL